MFDGVVWLRVAGALAAAAAPGWETMRAAPITASP